MEESLISSKARDKEKPTSVLEGWKKQRLVLLRRGNKPLEDASSYRPIRLLDTIGKLLEEMILQRLEGHMVGENSLAENQFGFWKGMPTVDAIQAVVDIATEARK